MSTYRKWDHQRPVEDVAIFMDDFFKYTAGDWAINTTEAGSGNATEAIADANGGVLVLTNDDASADVDQLQLAAETFKFAEGKKLSFKARLKLDNATLSDLVFGLCIRDTSLIASAPSDGIYFRKDAGDKLLDLVVAKNSTASTLTGIAGALTELADDTYVVAEFYYDGGPLVTSAGVEAGKVHAYINGTRVGALPLTNMVDDEELAVSFAIRNSTAVARSVSIDYVRVARQR